MADRFCIGGLLHRLLPGKVEVLHRLLGIATATVVMGQLTVVLVQGGTVKCFYGLRRALM